MNWNPEDDAVPYEFSSGSLKRCERCTGTKVCQPLKKSQEGYVKGDWLCKRCTEEVTHNGK